MNRADEALLEAWCAGELRAFDLLYARFEGPLFGFIHRQLGGAQADAEDVLHQVFLSVLEAGRAKRVQRDVALERARWDAAPGELPDVLLAGKQTARALHEALARMPSTLSEVYALRAAGLSYEEVAGMLQVPVGTVKSRLHELVSRLREELTVPLH